MVERGDGGGAGGVTGLFGATMQQAMTQIGSRLLNAQLARGFTVIRQSDGSVQLSLGIKPPGTKPLCRPAEATEAVFRPAILPRATRIISQPLSLLREPRQLSTSIDASAFSLAPCPAHHKPRPREPLRLHTAAPSGTAYRQQV